MDMGNAFIDSLNEIHGTLKQMTEKKLPLSGRRSRISTNFKKEKEQACYYSLTGHFKNLDKQVLEFVNGYSFKDNSGTLNAILQLVHQMKDFYLRQDYGGLLQSLDEMYNQIAFLQESPSKEKIRFKIARLPSDINEEVSADVGELEKCYKAGCYRSCIVLCGRILEICLHRKYFDVTGIDILEKNPGIGLGTLIAKMQEKNIKLSPGMTQQIHLINNVRVHTIHKKRELFVPSPEQTYAIILFTLDVINHLF